MKHLVRFPLQEGGSIVVEVDEPESEGTVRAARGDTIVKAKETLEEALNNVLPVTKSIVEKLRSIGNKPDEIEMTFGVSLNSLEQCKGLGRPPIVAERRIYLEVRERYLPIGPGVEPCCAGNVLDQIIAIGEQCS